MFSLPVWQASALLHIHYLNYLTLLTSLTSSTAGYKVNNHPKTTWSSTVIESPMFCAQSWAIYEWRTCDRSQTLQAELSFFLWNPGHLNFLALQLAQYVPYHVTQSGCGLPQQTTSGYQAVSSA